MAAFAPENTITFSSFSKAFAMTGWRIGYMIAPESINLTAKLINEAIAYSAPTPSQRAGIYALNHYDTLVPQVVAVFKERLTYIEQQVAEIPFLSLSPVKGSMYAFINIEQTGVGLCQLCREIIKGNQCADDPWESLWRNDRRWLCSLGCHPIVGLVERSFRPHCRVLI